MGGSLKEQLGPIREMVPTETPNKNLGNVQNREVNDDAEEAELRAVRRRERRASNESINGPRDLEESELTESERKQMFAAQIRRLEAEESRALEEARHFRSEKFLARSIGGSIAMMATGAFAIIVQSLLSD